MSFIPKALPNSVRESIKVLNEHTWVVGPLLLQRSDGRSDAATWYDESDDSRYKRIIPSSNWYTTLETSSAVWALGASAFCKVHILPYRDMTPEAATLAYVHEKKPDFAVPRILYNKEFDGRSYLFLSRVTGRTLTEAWPTLDDTWKNYYVRAVADVCQTMATWEGDEIDGVDGQTMYEPYLRKLGDKRRVTPELLLEGCTAAGMDCSKFVFQHADMGPTNIIVENVPDKGTIGVIDWEIAGFLPRGWIRIKFRVSGGMNPEGPGILHPHEYRREVANRLKELGFEEYADRWEAWFFEGDEEED